MQGFGLVHEQVIMLVDYRLLNLSLLGHHRGLEGYIYTFF